MTTSNTGAKMIPEEYYSDSPSSIISLFEDSESRWQAIVTRNPNADGFFIYAVKTTKIYCRPTCKARLARRTNVLFFNHASEAEAAGFRPCKRCKPDVAGFMPEEAAVLKIRSFVTKGVDGDGGMSLSQMARATGLSKWHFHRVFKRCVGVTPAEYLREQRVRREVGGEMPQWEQRVDDVVLDSDFNFAWLDEPVTGYGAADVQTSSAGFTAGDLSWTMDDLVAWPEDDLVRAT